MTWRRLEGVWLLLSAQMFFGSMGEKGSLLENWLQMNENVCGFWIKYDPSRKHYQSPASPILKWWSWELTGETSFWRSQRWRHVRQLPGTWLPQLASAVIKHLCSGISWSTQRFSTAFPDTSFLTTLEIKHGLCALRDKSSKLQGRYLSGAYEPENAEYQVFFVATSNCPTYSLPIYLSHPSK